MAIRLTILCENSVRPQANLIGEHGFACHVETPAGNYLFDTGQGFGIIQNALTLKKDLAKLKAILLSHGHYDHTGGLPEVLRRTGPIDVHGHPDLFLARYREDRFIGIPHRREYLEAQGARFILNREMHKVAQGLWLTGEVPRHTAFEQGDPLMTAVCCGTTSHDDILDDLSLVVESEKGLILVLGCAHAGLVNIMDHVLAKLGRDGFYAILGGTHLGFADDAQFERTLQALDNYKVEKLGVSHCTGLPHAARLQAILGERFFFGSVGSVLEG
ncbi:MBL fold metallo-hydrolase [Desulfuromonas acetexigens]|uniref:MBL fold metallo-hydrolase n=1 Tax=Trichloromonas acetexigens TaxID=38815 RepID=A0A550J6B3_9BACT|nr:MBL fold metallo-hydrolase [Desulfuromonas acetexigens]TRO78798.1 MBL fold metallo-hydrolase [Desulfuromonas acetexigens]